MNGKRCRSAAPLTCTLPVPFSTTCVLCAPRADSAVVFLFLFLYCEFQQSPAPVKLRWTLVTSSPTAPCRRPGRDTTAHRYSSIPTTTLAACPRRSIRPHAAVLLLHRAAGAHRSRTAARRTPPLPRKATDTAPSTSPRAWRNPPTSSSAVTGDCSTPNPPMRRLSHPQACAASC
jgi:hypothetical protein